MTRCRRLFRCRDMVYGFHNALLLAAEGTSEDAGKSSIE
jgi:hypothetical protein